MPGVQTCALDRKSTRLNSSHTIISYAVFCLKKKTVLLALVESGRPRDDAYRIVQRNARGAFAERTQFRSVLEADPVFFFKVEEPAEAFTFPLPLPLPS